MTAAARAFTVGYVAGIATAVAAAAYIVWAELHHHNNDDDGFDFGEWGAPRRRPNLTVIPGAGATR